MPDISPGEQYPGMYFRIGDRGQVVKAGCSSGVKFPPPVPDMIRANRNLGLWWNLNPNCEIVVVSRDFLLFVMSNTDLMTPMNLISGVPGKPFA
jgi:hypothetical protein